MRSIYNFTNKLGQSKARFLQNEWAKFYRRKFASYGAYLAAMESKAVINEQTQTYQFANRPADVSLQAKLQTLAKATKGLDIHQ